MKRLLLPVIFFLLLFIISLSGFFWWRENSLAPSSVGEKVRVVITKGKSAQEIANLLKEQGLIRNPLAFKLYVQFKGKSENIQAGEYRLSPNLSLSQIVDELLKGPSQLWITIPEGLRREEIVERFIKGLEMDAGKAPTFRKEFFEDKNAEEGFLFPDTYLMPRDVSASLVVKRMREVFDQMLAGEAKEAISKTKYSLAEIVTLASIIERETKTDSERPVVAGILFNRLDIGMGLQVDASLQYAVANAKCKMLNAKCENWWPILSKEDLRIESPYNTYKYRGLPPAAIANPGLSSLKAVVFPQETNYLYYLHDADGVIHFAATLDEHNENVRKYLGN